MRYSCGCTVHPSRSLPVAAAAAVSVATNQTHIVQHCETSGQVARTVLPVGQSFSPPVGSTFSISLLLGVADALPKHHKIFLVHGVRVLAAYASSRPVVIFLSGT